MAKEEEGNLERFYTWLSGCWSAEGERVEQQGEGI